jgi:hypothetical protein
MTGQLPDLIFFRSATRRKGGPRRLPYQFAAGRPMQWVYSRWSYKRSLIKSPPDNDPKGKDGNKEALAITCLVQTLPSRYLGSQLDLLPDLPEWHTGVTTRTRKRPMC